MRDTHGHAPLLRADEMRAVEREYAHQTPTLMERAGLAAADRALSLLAGQQGCVLVLAGPGNNGGDGFVVGRLLRAAGHDVVMVCAADDGQMPGDARAARLAWQADGGQTVTDFVGGQWALAIDALFGIGLTRPLEGRYADWITRLNTLNCPVLSLDVPSGIDADTGGILGVAVRASHTSTFIALKPGLLTLNGPGHCGELTLHSLDLPALTGAGQLLTRAHFAIELKSREANSHKGSFGQAGVIGGAAGMVGAALLAARAALYAGAGRVYVGLLDGHAPMVDLMQPELMLRPAGDLHLLCNALALGPGMGQSEIASQHLRRALGFAGALVLDADALNLLAATPTLQTMLAQREGAANAATILTPHPAEAARLLQCSLAEVQADRINMCCALARRYRAFVLLKGAGSIVAFPDGRWFVNTTGNAGLASAGTGDVLTGLVTALLAQGWDAGAALLAATHLHGAAADWLVAQDVGPVGMTAGELAPVARRLLNQWIAAEHNSSIR